VVDDICDGGGTFIGLADLLDERAMRADLYVTHGLFSQGTEKLVQRYSEHVICTDSIEHELTLPGVHVIPVCSNLLTTGAVT